MSGFEFTAQPVIPTEKVLRERPGLRHARNLPLTLVYEAAKTEEDDRASPEAETSNLGIPTVIGRYGS